MNETIEQKTKKPAEMEKKTSALVSYWFTVAKKIMRITFMETLPTPIPNIKLLVSFIETPAMPYRAL